jgi:hypothetical protein
MPTPALPHQTWLDSLASYPHWFVVACVTLVAAAVIWVLAKLLKWGLYAIIALVLVSGLGASVWLLFH